MGRKNIPWWLRIVAKLLLARLPVKYTFWKRLRLFEHGDMDQPSRAYQTYLEHAKTAGLSGSTGSFERNVTVLELGPGDSLYTAMIASTLGAARVWLVDAGTFATSDPIAYEKMADHLRSLGHKPPRLETDFDITDILRACNAEYLTEGVGSLSVIPDKSVDFCFSNAVLEHIPRREFVRLVAEISRILKPNGVSVHRVDLKDHLGGGLNSLRFSEATWEGPLFSRSGFYTNRIRFGAMMHVLENAGFRCTVPRTATWSTLPLSRDKMAEEFRTIPEEELLVSGFDVVLHPREST